MKQECIPVECVKPTLYCTWRVPVQGVLCPERILYPVGILCPGRSPRGQTDTCKIITLAQIWFAGGKYLVIQAQYRRSLKSFLHFSVNVNQP